MIPPTLVWLPYVYDRFKVFIGSDPDFANKITSGGTSLKRAFWAIPAAKWRKICAWPGSKLYLKIVGVDLGAVRNGLQRKVSSVVVEVNKH